MEEQTDQLEAVYFATCAYARRGAAGHDITQMM
jgi:hypothetical protein